MSEGVCAGAVAPTTIEHGSARESCRGATGLAAGTLSILLLLAGCTKVGPDFVKPDAPVAEQWTEVGQQDQSTITRGDIAGNLINMYRALGGGWQSRAGKDFVPESTKEQMAERTNWGDILTPDAQETALPPRSTPDDTYRWPDW